MRVVYPVGCKQAGLLFWGHGLPAYGLDCQSSQRVLSPRLPGNLYGSERELLAQDFRDDLGRQSLAAPIAAFYRNQVHGQTSN